MLYQQAGDYTILETPIKTVATSSDACLLEIICDLRQIWGAMKGPFYVAQRGHFLLFAW